MFLSHNGNCHHCCIHVTLVNWHLGGPKQETKNSCLCTPQQDMSCIHADCGLCGAAGGLLASLPFDQAQQCVEALQREGYHQACMIGHVRQSSSPQDHLIHLEHLQASQAN